MTTAPPTCTHDGCTDPATHIVEWTGEFRSGKAPRCARHTPAAMWSFPAEHRLHPLPTAPTTEPFEHTYAAKGYDDAGEHVGPGPWLMVVWAANEHRPGMFGTPRHEEDLPGVELYDDANIYHNGDTVTITSRTVDGADALTAAHTAVARATGTSLERGDTTPARRDTLKVVLP